MLIDALKGEPTIIVDNGSQIVVHMSTAEYDDNVKYIVRNGSYLDWRNNVVRLDYHSLRDLMRRLKEI